MNPKRTDLTVAIERLLDELQEVERLIDVDGDRKQLHDKVNYVTSLAATLSTTSKTLPRPTRG